MKFSELTTQQKERFLSKLSFSEWFTLLKVGEENFYVSERYKYV